MTPTFLATLALLLLAGAADAACLNADNQEPQRLEGQLVVHRVRNYERRWVPTFILRLAKPVCLEGKSEYDQVEDTREVHVFSLEKPMLRRLRQHAGKAVRVEGRPFGQVSYHHHYRPIVMDVARIDRR